MTVYVRSTFWAMQRTRPPHSSYIPLALRLVGTESGWKRHPGLGLTRAIKMNLTRSYSIELWHWPPQPEATLANAGLAINHPRLRRPHPLPSSFTLTTGRGALTLVWREEAVALLVKVQPQQRGWVRGEGHRDGGETVITREGRQVIPLGWKPGGRSWKVGRMCAKKILP